MGITGYKKSTLVTAVIINRNNKGLLLNCLESVKRQSTRPDEIIVIDNGSEDGSAEVARQRFPEARLVENKLNSGFSASCNQGVRLAGGEFILLLNNDVVLDRYFVEALLAVMHMDEKIGIGGGKVLSHDGRYLDSAGQLLARSRKVMDRGYREADNGKYNQAHPVFSIAASAALYRRKMLEDVKEGDEYFDEDFEFFYEDIDLAWRAKKRDWEVFYEPRAIAYHRRGATAKTKAAPMPLLEKYYISHLDPELQCCAIRNRYLMMLKNDSVKGIITNFPFILWHEIKQAGYVLLFEPTLIRHLFAGRRPFANSLSKRKKFMRRSTIIGKYKNDQAENRKITTI
jgi:GT2 family glycosyltransferase